MPSWLALCSHAEALVGVIMFKPHLCHPSWSESAHFCQRLIPGWAGLGLKGASQNHCGMEAAPCALHPVGTCVYTTNSGQAWAGLLGKVPPNWVVLGCQVVGDKTCH